MNTGQSGIIYASTRKEVERIYHLLESKNCSWDVSWGMSEQLRSENQEAFLYDQVQVMVATNAFGMGLIRVMFVLSFTHKYQEILNLITKKRAELVVTVYLVMLC